MANSNNVLRIVVYTSGKTYATPWENDGATEFGTAFLVGKNTLLTCHHVIEGATGAITVFAGGKQHTCEIIRVNYELDMALLRIDASYKSGRILTPATSAAAGDDAWIAGYTAGFKSFQMNRVELNRLEVLQYTPISRGLAIHCSPAVSNGMSGSPAVNKAGKVVGMLISQTGRGTTNVDSLIPFYAIDRFINSPNKIFADIPFRWQPLLNKNLQHMIGGHGIFVLSDWKPHISNNDMITHIDGHEITNGILMARDFVKFKSDSVITFQQAMSLSSKHTITLEGTTKVKIELPWHKCNYVKPQYFNYGGLLFIPITPMLIDNTHRHLAEYIGMPLLAEVMTTDNTLGYGGFIGGVPVEIDGKELKSYEDLKKMLTIPKPAPDDYVTFAFEFDERLMIVNAAQANADTKLINDEYFSC